MTNHYATDNDSCTNFLNLKLVKKNKNKIKDRLEEEWENFLKMYKKVTQESSQNYKKNFHYFCQINISSNYNYFILAQINHLLSYNKNVQYLIRKLAQKEVQLKYKAGLFSQKSNQNSLFVKWLLRLWSIAFAQYMQKYSRYLGETPWLWPLQHIKIQYLKNNIYVSSKDLLLM